MNAPSRFDDLLRRWSDRDASVEELAELEGLLRSDARYRRALVRMVRLDVALHARYARSAAPAGRKGPGRNLPRAAAVLAVGLSLAAASWLLLRSPGDPKAWRVASGMLRVAGEPSGRLEPGQAFHTGPEPVRLALADGILELDPATSGGRETLEALRLDRGGVRIRAGDPLRVETPVATLALRGAHVDIRVHEVPVCADFQLIAGEAEARYGDLAVRLRPGPPLRLGGPRTLDRTEKTAELLGAAAFDLATALDRVAADVRGVPFEAALEFEEGRPAFAVEVAEGAEFRERTIDAATGEILEDDTEKKDRSALAARIRIPLATAVRAALQAVPGRAVQAACEVRDGTPRARVEVVTPAGSFEVVVDLDRGHVASIAR